MNIRKLLVSGLMLISVLFSACAPAVTPLAATTVPATATVYQPTATSTPFATKAPTEIPMPMPAPITSVVLAEWDVGLYPTNIAFGFDSVWVASHRDPNATTRIDPATNKVVAVIQDTGYFAGSVLVVDDSVWMDGQVNDTVKIDAKTNAVVARLPGNHIGLAYGFGSVWSTGPSDTLYRIDPVTARNIIAPVRLGDSPVDFNSWQNEVMVSTSAVWVNHRKERELIKIDPTTNNIVLRIPYDKVVEEAKSQTTVPAGKGTDFLWLNLENKELIRVDPNTGAGLSFLSHVGSALAVTDEAVWVININLNHPLLMRLNVATNQIDATYTVGSGVARIGVGFGSVWVAYNSRLVRRLDIVP